jgi:hypothetical protein
MDMGARRASAIYCLICLLICIHVSVAAGQALVFGDVPCNASQKDSWSAADFNIGWMTAPQKIRVGYDGLVLPGACISSFFVYPLSGVQVGGSLPFRLTDRYCLRVYGTYLIAHNPEAGQEITWTNNPPGTREWRHSNSQWYKVGGEVLHRTSDEAALVVGFRLDSLLTNFSDPNPDYLFTIAAMEAQTTVTVYEPYVGIRLQLSPGAGGLTVQAVGFPVLFAGIEHLNVCNNHGTPFAHTGRKNATKGYFAELSAEYRLALFKGLEAAAFVDWNVYQGHCSMTIERHEGGATPGVTSGTVAWSHDISSLTVGGKVEMSWNLPF